MFQCRPYLRIEYKQGSHEERRFLVRKSQSHQFFPHPTLRGRLNSVNALPIPIS